MFHRVYDDILHESISDSVQDIFEFVGVHSRNQPKWTRHKECSWNCLEHLTTEAEQRRSRSKAGISSCVLAYRINCFIKLVLTLTVHKFGIHWWFFSPYIQYGSGNFFFLLPREEAKEGCYNVYIKQNLTELLWQTHLHHVVWKTFSPVSKVKVSQIYSYLWITVYAARFFGIFKTVFGYSSNSVCYSREATLIFFLFCVWK